MSRFATLRPNPPLQGAGVAAAVQATYARSMVRDARSVLVVDDDESMRVTLMAALDGYDIHLAASGAEAMAQMEARPFDAVVCDLVMPVMSGIELYESLDLESPLREHFLFMTGGSLPPAIESFVALSTVPVLRKPFQVSELREAVAAVVGA